MGSRFPLLTCPFFEVFYPVFEVSFEGELVFRFAVRDFVASEPIDGGLQVPGFVPPHVIDACVRRKNPGNGGGLCVCGVFVFFLPVPLYLAASGSSVLITMTFQSVSPSSIKASVPSTFTLMTSPREHTWKLIVFKKKWGKLRLNAPPHTLFPMSHMSIGSLSPQHPVSLSWWLGSSHVCEGEKNAFRRRRRDRR